MFVALTAPDIMCPDRRQRVLPLLFARPLTGVDYVIAKVGAMFAILFAFSFLPQVVLFVGQMLVSDDGALRYARDNAEVIWQVPDRGRAAVASSTPPSAWPCRRSPPGGSSPARRSSGCSS